MLATAPPQAIECKHAHLKRILCGLVSFPFLVAKCGIQAILFNCAKCQIGLNTERNYDSLIF